MGNTIQHPGDKVLGVFDLKGSLVNRRSKDTDRILKDKNLLEINRKKMWMNFRDQDKRQIIDTLKSDLSLLVKFNLMDYSLLMCVTENPNWIQNMNDEERQ